MRFRTIVALTMLAVAGLMSIYILAYGRHMQLQVDREVAGFAQVFANLLTAGQEANANAYAKIIVDQGRFRSIDVTIDVSGSWTRDHNQGRHDRGNSEKSVEHKDQTSVFVGKRTRYDPAHWKALSISDDQEQR